MNIFEYTLIEETCDNTFHEKPITLELSTPPAPRGKAPISILLTPPPPRNKSFKSSNDTPLNNLERTSNSISSISSISPQINTPRSSISPPPSPKKVTLQAPSPKLRTTNKIKFPTTPPPRNYSIESSPELSPESSPELSPEIDSFLKRILKTCLQFRTPTTKNYYDVDV